MRLIAHVPNVCGCSLVVRVVAHSPNEISAVLGHSWHASRIAINLLGLSGCNNVQIQNDAIKNSINKIIPDPPQASIVGHSVPSLVL